MKINYQGFDFKKEYVIEEDVDLSQYPFPKGNRIDHIEFCHAVCKAIRYEDCLKISLFLKGGVVGVCSYSLDKFVYPYSVKEEILFSKEEDSDYQLLPGALELNPIIISLIDSAIPFNLRKPGAKMPEDGKGYRVLTEESLIEERKHTKDPRWDKLDELL